MDCSEMGIYCSMCVRTDRLGRLRCNYCDCGMGVDEIIYGDC